MALDDKDNLIIRGENISFKFGSEKAKNSFLKILTNMTEKQERIDGEGYTCGNCAVYPCFRLPSVNQRAGLCFQNVRICTGNCDFYRQEKESVSIEEALNIKGFCRKDNTEVKYEQECYIPEMKKSRL